MSHNGAPRTIKKMEKTGITVAPTQMSEEHEAGGAVTLLDLSAPP